MAKKEVRRMVTSGKAQLLDVWAKPIINRLSLTITSI
jgi:hypothetical protein